MHIFSPLLQSCWAFSTLLFRILLYISLFWKIGIWTLLQNLNLRWAWNSSQDWRFSLFTQVQFWTYLLIFCFWDCEKQWTLSCWYLCHGLPPSPWWIFRLLLFCQQLSGHTPSSASSGGNHSSLTAPPFWGQQQQHWGTPTFLLFKHLQAGSSPHTALVPLLFIRVLLLLGVFLQMFFICLSCFLWLLDCKSQLGRTSYSKVILEFICVFF